MREKLIYEYNSRNCSNSISQINMFNIYSYKRCIIVGSQKLFIAKSKISFLYNIIYVMLIADLTLHSMYSFMIVMLFFTLTV